MIAAGQIAPDFTLPATGGGTVTLSALRPGRVCLYFYPRDNTPACTLEAQEFSALAADFAALDCRVLGISKDSVKVHEGFCQRQGLGITLLSDKDGGVCEAYGAWGRKRLYGRDYEGILRATVLIDGKGRVLHAWPEVSARGHAADVLAALHDAAGARA